MSAYGSGAGPVLRFWDAPEADGAGKRARRGMERGHAGTTHRHNKRGECEREEESPVSCTATLTDTTSKQHTGLRLPYDRALTTHKKASHFRTMIDTDAEAVAVAGSALE